MSRGEGQKRKEEPSAIPSPPSANPISHHPILPLLMRRHETRAGAQSDPALTGAEHLEQEQQEQEQEHDRLRQQQQPQQPPVDPQCPSPSPEPTAAGPPRFLRDLLSVANLNQDGLLPATHWLNTEPELADDESRALSTASLSESIRGYRTIDGRTYHSERGSAQYWASNDDAQNESLHYYHWLVKMFMHDKLFFAPLEPAKLKTALDIGTGTGAWAIDFADEFPDCLVTGTDISPIQPNWIPPNVRFEIEDCTEPWTFPANSVDYVHMRLLYGSITDWPKLFREAYRICRPGGWIESFECSAKFESDDGTVDEGSAMGQWGRLFIEGGKILGRTFEILDHDVQREAMRALGLEDVQVWDNKCPIGAWPRDPYLNEVGRLAQLTLEQDISGYVSLMAHLVQGWDAAAVAIYAAHVRAEVRSVRHHGYYRQRAVWGMKPLCAT